MEGAVAEVVETAIGVSAVAFVFAWLVILPTIGLLWLCGALS